jgi:hypothetical protein
MGGFYITKPPEESSSTLFDLKLPPDSLLSPVAKLCSWIF